MTWWQFSLLCQAAELEQVEEILLSLGAVSITLADAGDEPIYEPLPGSNPVWQESIVTATFDSEADNEILQQQLRQVLPAHIAAGLKQQVLQQRDWIQAYKNHFQPMQCAPGLWIVPSWCEAPDPEATIIRLDPGLAFGTGSHPTTALCLAWLGAHSLAELDVIDYGCGSGILAIAACKLGARRVIAVDIDAQALSASADNLQLNQVDSAKIHLSEPRYMDDKAVDLLIANILAGPLIDLAPDFSRRVKPGGRILLSGILKSQLKEIQSAYRPYFDLDSPDQREDWVCVGGTRKQ